MKLFFVGEGPHEVGHDPGQHEAFEARGVVPALVRRAGIAAGGDSLATFWRRLTRLSKERKGFASKAKAAVLVAKRRHGCDGVVMVVDNDTKDDENRLARIQSAQPDAEVPVACGLAVQSIEAWTLGAASALAAELGVDVSQVRELYPHRSVEDLSERSGKEDLRPKPLLDRIAKLARRAADSDFCEAVAARTDVDELSKACPRGFAPFVKELHAAFGGATP
jgi:hypothetical protein